ncbi:MAG: hypothetical protein OEU92_08065 [Alphaproteobacteria bacterium]|nr:hypothetical protein [Alphaproteobacteria bacterium]
MAAYWSRLGLPFIEEAFEWNAADTPQDWQAVSGWHQRVGQSRTIHAASADEEAEAHAAFHALAKTAPHLTDYLAHHLPSYEKLRRRALKPG